MRVARFTDEYELVAPLYGVSADDLRGRDLERSEDVGRWMVFDGDHVVGAGTSFLRPDDRRFLRCVSSLPGAYPPLIEAAAAALGRPLHISVDADDQLLIATLVGSGLEEEYRAREFRLRFDTVLERLGRERRPAGYEIHRADTVDPDALFELDCELRRLTPGTDGWLGNREWFDSELAGSPPFDASAYLVASGPGGTLTGLVRIWRNPGEPSLGLIGVLPAHRHTTIAAALLHRSLSAAATWGSDTFVAASSPSNPVIYSRMTRLEAEPLGGTVRLVYR